MTFSYQLVNQNYQMQQTGKGGFTNQLKQEFQAHLNYFNRKNLHKTVFCKHSTDDCLSMSRLSSQVSVNSLVNVQSMCQLGQATIDPDLMPDSENHEVKQDANQFYGVDPVQHPFLFAYLHPKPEITERSGSKLKDSVKRYTEHRRNSKEKEDKEGKEARPRSLVRDQMNIQKLAERLSSIMSNFSTEIDCPPQQKGKDESFLATKTTIETQSPEAAKSAILNMHKTPDKMRRYASPTTYLEWLRNRTSKDQELINSLFAADNKQYTHNFKKEHLNLKRFTTKPKTRELQAREMAMIRLKTRLIKSVFRRKSPDIYAITQRASQDSVLFKATHLE